MAIYSIEQMRDQRRPQTRDRVAHIARQATERNVAPVERWLSALSGTALAVIGLMRRGWLGIGLTALGGELLYRGVSGHSFIYQMMGKNTTEQPLSLSDIPMLSGAARVCVQCSRTINRSPEELYTFWRKLENTPRFMPGVISVEQTSPRTSHWIARGPGNRAYEWDAELAADEPGRHFAWHVTPTDGLPIASDGSVHFTPAPGGRGTVVTLGMDNVRFRGPLGKIVGRVSEFETQEVLRRFKEVMEAGEVPTIAGQPSGRGGS